MTPLETRFQNLRAKAREFQHALNQFWELADGSAVFSGGCRGIEAIQQCVADHYSQHIQVMSVKSRVQTIVMPRMVAMAICRKITKHSHKEIAACFGGRDHGAVVNAVQTIERRIATEKPFSAEYLSLTKKCANRLENVDTPLFAEHHG